MAERRRKAATRDAKKASTEERIPAVADIGVLGLLQGRAHTVGQPAQPVPPVPIIMKVLLGIMLIGLIYATIEMLPPSIEYFSEAYRLWKSGQLE